MYNSIPAYDVREHYYEDETRVTRRRTRQRPTTRDAKESLDEQLEAFNNNLSTMADYIAGVVKKTIEMQVFPDVLPGTLRKKLKGINKHNLQTEKICIPFSKFFFAYR